MAGASLLSIGSLADAAGVSRRTVRFYVQRGLLPAPVGLGRGAHYTEAHLARLLEIKTWQEQGFPLDEVRARLGLRDRRASRDRRTSAKYPLEVQAPSEDDAPGNAWFRQPLMSGFELHVAGGRTPLSAEQLAQLSRHLHAILDQGDQK